MLANLCVVPFALGIHSGRVWGHCFPKTLQHKSLWIFCQTQGWEVGSRHGFSISITSLIMVDNQSSFPVVVVAGRPISRGTVVGMSVATSVVSSRTGALPGPSFLCSCGSRLWSSELSPLALVAMLWAPECLFVIALFTFITWLVFVGWDLKALKLPCWERERWQGHWGHTVCLSSTEWIGNRRGESGTWVKMALERTVTPLGPSCGPHDLLEFGESY